VKLVDLHSFVLLSGEGKLSRVLVTGVEYEVMPENQYQQIIGLLNEQTLVCLSQQTIHFIDLTDTLMGQSKLLGTIEHHLPILQVNVFQSKEMQPSLLIYDSMDVLSLWEQNLMSRSIDGEIVSRTQIRELS